MTGPLMWAIVAMRNSLVFHDGDKITTLMMHASPALCAWCACGGCGRREAAGWRVILARQPTVLAATHPLPCSPPAHHRCMRWYPRPEWTAGWVPERVAAWNSASLFDMAVMPAALNLAWVVCYYMVGCWGGRSLAGICAFLLGRQGGGQPRQGAPARLPAPAHPPAPCALRLLIQIIFVLVDKKVRLCCGWQHCSCNRPCSSPLQGAPLPPAAPR